MLELTIVSKVDSDEPDEVIQNKYTQILNDPIDLVTFARSVFCAQFTLPLFVKTIPLQLKPTWNKRALEPSTYASGAQLLSHLTTISSGDAKLLRELCEHWTHCCISTWVKLDASNTRRLLSHDQAASCPLVASSSSQQYEAIQFEVSYLTNGDSLLTADIVEGKTLLISDDIGHILRQTPVRDRVMIRVKTGAIYAVSVGKIANPCKESDGENLPHLPNYSIHHVVRLQGRAQGTQSVQHYEANSKQFRGHYESRGIVRDVSGCYEKIQAAPTLLAASVKTKQVAKTASKSAKPVVSTKRKRVTDDKTTQEEQAQYKAHGAYKPSQGVRVFTRNEAERELNKNSFSKDNRKWTIVHLFSTGWVEGYVTSRILESDTYRIQFTDGQNPAKALGGVQPRQLLFDGVVRYGKSGVKSSPDHSEVWVMIDKIPTQIARSKSG
jgi:hypothetical protein